MPGGALDLPSLCVIPGKACWLVYVDALLLNDGGNVLDALSVATRAALALTRVPKVRAAAGWAYSSCCCLRRGMGVRLIIHEATAWPLLHSAEARTLCVPCVQRPALEQRHRPPAAHPCLPACLMTDAGWLMLAGCVWAGGGEHG